MVPRPIGPSGSRRTPPKFSVRSRNESRILPRQRKRPETGILCSVVPWKDGNQSLPVLTWIPTISLNKLKSQDILALKTNISLYFQFLQSHLPITVLLKSYLKINFSNLFQPSTEPFSCTNYVIILIKFQFNKYEWQFFWVKGCFH